MGMKYLKKKRVFSFVLLFMLAVSALLFRQCTSRQQQTTTETVSETEHGTHEEVVRLTPEELKEFGVEISGAGAGLLEQHVDLTGEIVIDPARLAHIVPRFPGIVKEVRKKIGDRVKKGEVLAIIESNESLSPYKVKSLIDGTVIDMHLTRGEVITDEGHAFTVADLSKVWANLNIYQKDLPFVKIGQKAIISAGPASQQATGRISYISPIVDEKTRTATARVILPNPRGIWKPGLFVNARVIIANKKVAVKIPKTALQTFEGKTVVFVKDKDGFRPQPVEIGRSNQVAVEIVRGLQPGQEYVSKGGFTLKSELQKEAFGGDEH